VGLAQTKGGEKKGEMGKKEKGEGKGINVPGIY
jgi:hypothetical protein